MRIYILTSVGNAIASNPNQSGSTASRILSYLRRHGKQSSDEALCDHLGLNGTELNTAMKDLERNQAVRCVVST